MAGIGGAVAEVGGMVCPEVSIAFGSLHCTCVTGGFISAILKAMKPYQLLRQQWLPAPLDQVFAFFSRPENLQTLTPPFLDFQVLEVPQQMQAGSLIRYKLRLHGIPIRWTTRITEWNPPHGFKDDQLSGPYAFWHHEHRFVAERGGTTMFDDVKYALPFGILAAPAHWLFVKRDVNRVFDYREKRMKELFGV